MYFTRPLTDIQVHCCLPWWGQQAAAAFGVAVARRGITLVCSGPDAAAACGHACLAAGGRVVTVVRRYSPTLSEHAVIFAIQCV